MAQPAGGRQAEPLLKLIASFAAVTLIGSAVPAIASATSVITISGATASFPLVQLLAHKYSKLKHNKVSFRISQGGATVGINDVAAGRVTIGDVSRDPLPTDPAGLDFYPIAEYGICIVTNKSNPLSSFNEAQVQAIFEGKDKEWSQVLGASVSGPIDLISRTSTAGVLTNFKTLFLANKSVASTAAEEPSEGLLEQQVANDPQRGSASSPTTAPTRARSIRSRTTALPARAPTWPPGSTPPPRASTR